jgi:hypothetical protein
VKYIILALGFCLFSIGVAASLSSQPKAPPALPDFAIRGKKIPPGILRKMREQAVPDTIKPADPARAKINRAEAMRIATADLGELASLATDVKVEHLATSSIEISPIDPNAKEEATPAPIQQVVKPRNAWVITFDSVGRGPVHRRRRPQSLNPSKKTDPTATETAYLQTIIFIDSETGEIYQRIEASLGADQE